MTATPASCTTFLFNGMPAVRLCAADGARAVVLLHGAHIVSWQPVGDDGQAGDERLYLSDQAVFAEGQAVRGGVPVIFPQFERRGPLPRHGLARTRNWSVADMRADADHALVVLRLTDDDATHEHWPHAFAAELTVSVAGARLDIELSAENLGQQPFSFTAALHTYLRVDDIAHARISGLSGLGYLDSLTGAQHIETAPAVAVDGEIDRIYFHAAQALTLRDTTRALAIQSQQFDDVVVWNPGPDKCAMLADMPAEGWREMLCVEAAHVGNPVTLAPGDTWCGRQSLIALR